MAIAQSPHGKATVTEIYTFIAQRFPYFKHRKRILKHALCNSLSGNKRFVKVPRKDGGHHYWMLDPKFKKRIESDNSTWYRRLRWVIGTARQAAAAPEMSPGSGAASQQQDGDSTSTPTSARLFASELGSTERAAPDSSRPGVDCHSDHIPVPDTEMSADGAATLASPCGGTRNSCADDTRSDARGSTAGSAADGVCKERSSGDTGSADTKPPFSYEELIAMAMAESLHRRATVSEINAYITSRFPYFKSSNKSWQKSIRCTLFFSKYFIRVPPEGGNREGGGCQYWMLNPQYEDAFKNGAFRGEQLFRSGTAPSVPPSTGAPRHPRDARPQLLGDVGKHSTASATSTGLSVSEVSCTSRVATDSSHAGGRRRVDDTPALDVSTRTVDAGTPDDRRAAGDNAAGGGGGGERRLVGTATASTRPPLSYKALINMAIAQSPHRRATASEIISYIVSRFPFFKRKKQSCKNAVHCTLSSSKCFIKAPREGSNNYGSHWTVDPQYQGTFKKVTVGQHRRWKQPFRRSVGAVAAPEVQPGASAASRLHDARGQQQLPGTGDQHSPASHTGDDMGGTTAGSAAHEASEVLASGDPGTAGIAKTKPPFSYEELIAMAIMEKPHRRATVSEIIAYISSHFPYFERSNKSWQKSIECRLTFGKYFVKLQLQGGNCVGKCFNYWMIGPQYKKKFKNVNSRQHRHWKWPFQRAPGPGAVAAPEVPNGAAAACHPRGAHHHHQPQLQEGSLPPQPSPPSAGGYKDSAASHTGDDTGGTTAGSAADGASEVLASGDPGTAGIAKTKPPFSYEELIAMAITEKPHRRATVSEIIAYISSHFPYFERSNKSWQKSIECRLTFGKYFVKLQLQGGNHVGRCFNYYMLDPQYKGVFKNGKFHLEQNRKRPFHRALGAAAAPACRPHRDGLPVQTQLPGDGDRHSTATRASTGTSVSEVGSTGRGASDSSQTGGSRREDDSPTTEVKVSTVAAGIPMSASCVTDGIVVSVPTGDAGAAAKGVAASGCLADTDSVRPAGSRPLLTYKALIAAAIAQSPHRRATLSEIFTYVSNRLPNSRRKTKAWRHTLSCTLSSSQCFVRVPGEGGGRSNYWTLDPEFKGILKNGNFRRRQCEKRPFRRPLRAAAAPEVPRGSGVTDCRHRQHHDSRPEQPQLPGDVIERRIATPMSTSPSVSEVDSSGRAAPSSSEPGSGRYEDDTPSSVVAASPGGTEVPSSAACGSDTDSGGTVVGGAVDRAAEERCSGGGSSARDADAKPPFSYTQLSAMAITQSLHRRATLSEIISYIVKRFPYFERNGGWQKSLCNNLSRNKIFVNVLQRSGKQAATYWMLDPRYKDVTKSGTLLRHQSAERPFYRAAPEASDPRSVQHDGPSARPHPPGAADTSPSEPSAIGATGAATDRGVSGGDGSIAGGAVPSSAFLHSATPTALGLSVSEFDGVDRAAPNSSHREDDVRAANVVSATLTSPSGGTGSDGGGSVVNGGAVEERSPRGDDAAGAAEAERRVCYEEIIARAIANSPHGRATTSEIYGYIRNHFAYFRRCTKNWQKSVYCKLSFSKYFIKVPREGCSRKGSRKGDCFNYWTLNPQYKGVFKTGKLQRQQSRQRPLRRALAAVAAPEVPRGTRATDRLHQAGPPVRPQLPGAVDEHSTATRASTSTLVSEVGDTGRSAPNSSHTGGSRREDDTRAPEAEASAVAASTSTSASRVAGTGSGGGEQRRLTGTGCARPAGVRPLLTYKALTAAAIARSPNRRATLSEIFAYISSHFPYSSQRRKPWRHTLSCTLSSSQCFVRVPGEGGGRSNYWTLDPQYEDAFDMGSFHPRQRIERSPARDGGVGVGGGALPPHSPVEDDSRSSPAARDLDCGGSTFPCSVCHKVFTRKYNMKNHLLLHTGEHPHRCSICGESFRLRSELKTHLSSHSGEWPFACVVCDKKFVTDGDLKRHSWLHSRGGSYSCSLCHKRFATSGKLKEHSLLHTGRCPYRCGFCRKPFLSAFSLRRHLLVHTASVRGGQLGAAKTEAHAESGSVGSNTSAHLIRPH